MKAAEAAFKDSVDVWEGGTDTEFGMRHEAPPGAPAPVLKPVRTAVEPDIAAMQQIVQRHSWNAAVASLKRTAIAPAYR